MCRKLICLTSFVLVLALAGSVQAELLVNGDFEAGIEPWSSWGSGSGSGSGGYLWTGDYHVTILEDGTAHGGSKYVEVGMHIPPENTEWWGWGYAIIWQNLPVSAGNTYHASAWVRDGNADGVSSLIEGGTQIVFEWFADADTRLDVNGDGETNNDDKNFYTFDLTEEWTQISATEVVPPGATMSRVLFGTGQMRVNVDVDDTSVTEAGEPAPPSNYVTSTDQDGLIPIINRDFSEPNDGKHTAFDIETSRKQDEPFFGFMTTDVPGWTTDVSAKDSGIEIGGDPNYGYSAFLMGGYSEWDDDPNWVEPSIWQILPYKIQEGDQFRLAVDARHIWTVAGVQVELKMTLFYVDINGARQELASQIVDLTEAWEWGTYVLDVSELNEMAVGKLLGIELQNITIRSSWIHVDNVSLIGE
jgi:hypothetical protein